MIKRIEITFDDNPDEAPLCWDFDYTLTKSVNIEDDFNEIEPPEWSKLENHKCSNCTLKSEDHPFCPAARSLYSYAKNIINRKSIDTATVHIWDKSGRHLQLNKLPLQEITGEIVRMSVFQSACPVGRRARKVVDFIPPFPANEEVIKAFALFFAIQKLQNSDNDQDKNAQYLNTLNDVFANLSHRIQDFSKGDAGVNGVLIYHSLMMLMSLSLPKELEKAIKSLGEDF